MHKSVRSTYSDQLPALAIDLRMTLGVKLACTLVTANILLHSQRVSCIKHVNWYDDIYADRLV